MKRIITATALFASIGSFAQGRLELTGSIAGLSNNDKVYLFGVNNRDIDSAVIKDNGFAFNKEIPKGGDIYLMIVGKAKSIQEDQSHGTALYLGPGKVTVSGSGPYFMNAKFTGPAFINDWIAMNALMYDTTKFRYAKTIDGLMDEAKRVGDGDRYRELLHEHSEYQKQQFEIGKKWVADHPNSPISSFVLSAYLSPLSSMHQTGEYLDKLSADAKSNAIAESIQNLLNADTSTVVGKTAPEFTMPDMNGKSVSLSSYKGKYVLLDFWASWCKPCRAQNPGLKTLYEKYKNRNFTIIGVSMDNDKSKWLSAIAQDQLPWIHVSDLSLNNAAAKLYHIVFIPSSLLIGPDGKIISRLLNEKELDEELNRRLPAN